MDARQRELESLRSELRLAEEKLDRFFELVPDLLAIGTPGGGWIKVNLAWQRALGYTSEELLSLSIFDLIHPDDLNSTMLEVARQQEGRHVLNFVNRFRTKDVGYRWLEWSASPAEDGLLFAVARDITDRIRDEEQRRLMADAFTFCSHGIAIGDQSTGRIISCNPAFATLHGFTVAELEGRLFLELYAEFQRDYVSGILKQFEGEKNISFEAFKIRKDGSLVPVQMDVVNVFDSSGKLVYQIATAQDITARRSSEGALRESEHRFRSVVESAPDAIFIQTKGVFAYLNPAALAFFGAADAEELLGKPVLDRVHPEFLERVAERVRMLNEERRAVPIQETTYLRLDGSTIDAEVSAVPFLYNGQKGALVFFRDISDRKEAEAERGKLEAQLFQAQKMESIGRLAGGVAHDLNNMLTPIIGYSELLQDQFFKDDRRLAAVEGIHSAGLRSRDLVHQLLAFSRKQQRAVNSIDLNVVISGFEQLLRRTIRENVDIRYNLSPATLNVRGDLGHLEQVIMNLAVNAQDSMAEGGTITITTSTAEVTANDYPCVEGVREGSYAKLTIADTGSGMDSETVAHVFEPFFTTKDEGLGTGLGLAIVYGIIRQHDGVVTASSLKGRGSVFTILIPLESSKPEISACILQPSLKRKRACSIIVVEDNEMVRRFVVQTLELEGYDVIEASGGEEAVRMTEEQNLCPDILLTDVVMRGMNGRELYETMKVRCPGIKVLFMSGYTHNVLIQHGIEEGGSFIEKPFSIEALDAKLQELLGHSATLK
ncbi:MAG: PAS domain S-box protein [Chlorobiaceae bacterium]